MKINFCNFMILSLTLAFATSLSAQETSDTMQKVSGKDKQAIMASALSAAPMSISKHATVMNWPEKEGGELVMVRKGTNGYTCLPDMPQTKGTDPMCLDEPWMQWVDAWMNKQEVSIDRIGFGYMLQGGSAESNTDPYATEPTKDNEWMEKGVPHLMIVVPNPEMLTGLPTTSEEGGPWVMWRDTPYVHIMAPMPKHVSSSKMAGTKKY